MSITYDWKITTSKTKNEGLYEKVIVQSYWTKTGTDENGNVGTFSGTTNFTTSNVPENFTFIPFENVTDEMILNWIKESISVDFEQQINNIITKQINDKINPTGEITPPWYPTM